MQGDSALHVARCLHGALRGFIMLEQKRGMGLAIGVDESFDMLLEILTAGIAEAAGRMRSEDQGTPNRPRKHQAEIPKEPSKSNRMSAQWRGKTREGNKG